MNVHELINIEVLSLFLCLAIGHGKNVIVNMRAGRTIGAIRHEAPDDPELVFGWNPVWSWDTTAMRLVHCQRNLLWSHSTGDMERDNYGTRLLGDEKAGSSHADGAERRQYFPPTSLLLGSVNPAQWVHTRWESVAYRGVLIELLGR